MINTTPIETAEMARKRQQWVYDAVKELNNPSPYELVDIKDPELLDFYYKYIEFCDHPELYEYLKSKNLLPKLNKTTKPTPK